MLVLRFLVAAAVLVAPVLAAGTIPKEEYRARRDALRKALPDGVTVLFGRTGKEVAPFRTTFLQEPNFFYLTGWREPGAILILAAQEETLLLPARDPKAEVYTGRRVGPGDPDAAEITGFASLLPVEHFETRLSKLLESQRKVYTLAGSPAEERLRAMLPLREIADAGEAIWKRRLKKSPREVELIQQSVDASIEGHLAAWKRIATGSYEYQAAAAMVGAWLGLGCERSAYPPIVASGPNATILHYDANTRRMDSGDLLLIDAAAECSGYAADITRTVPVNGRFTPRQRELYEIVLGAQKAAIAAVKPGATLDKGTSNSVNDAAYDYINSHGKDRQGQPLGKYVLHTTSHHVGLDVHDGGKLFRHGPLEPGMVITVEPGIYLPDEGIGIRIEDTVLVTESGGKVLSSALPKEVDDIERTLAK